VCGELFQAERDENFRARINLRGCERAKREREGERCKMVIAYFRFIVIYHRRVWPTPTSRGEENLKDIATPISIFQTFYTRLIYVQLQAIDHLMRNLRMTCAETHRRRQRGTFSIMNCTNISFSLQIPRRALVHSLLPKAYKSHILRILPHLLSRKP
jgi:hypothetical protein